MTQDQKIILYGLYFGFIGAMLFEVVSPKIRKQLPSGPSFAEHWQLQRYVQALELRLKHLEVDLGLPPSRTASA